MRGKTRLWGICTFLLLVTCGSDVTAPPEEAVSVLMVGNSLTYWNDMPQMLQALLEAGGHGPALVRSSSFPNYGLQDHWVDDRTRDQLDVGGWDYVVLQQGPSATEGRPSLLEYSERFADVIRQGGATPALYMVWPATARSFDFDGVSESYQMAAARVQGVLFPAGESWRAAWRRDDSLALYGPDGFHPSALGSYLAALTMYQRMTGVRTRDVPAEIRTEQGAIPINEALADLLFDAALEANGMFGAAPVSSGR